MMYTLVFFCFFAQALCSSPEENLADNLFEGDMVLTPQQMLAIEGYARGSFHSGHWQNGVVPYVIEKSLSTQSRAMSAIEAGLSAWSSTTCLKFVERTNEKDYISMFKGGGCWSYIGRIGGKQQLSLASGCWSKGVVAHELGHALGFYHEQSRPDRDQFVTIKWENIKDGKAGNFKKYSTNSVETNYDYRSIMHYGRNYFTKNGRDTIVTKNGASIGNRRDLTATDIYEMNLRYECLGGTTAAPPTTQPRPPDSCKDRSASCVYWEMAGYCVKYEHALRYWCPNTCKFCQPAYAGDFTAA